MLIPPENQGWPRRRRLTGSEGKDTVYGGKGDDTIAANVGADELYGDKGETPSPLPPTKLQWLLVVKVKHHHLTSAVDIADEKAHTIVGGAGNDTSLLLVRNQSLTVAAKIRITPLLTTPQFSSTPLENSSKAMILLTKSP